ncbi:MAG: hypothetical protein EAZ24_03700 [Burkholderiales bacterium]|nr:MAG: hypothetical protein EAZ21_12430 [Betaproteobacteria bacterium]TAG82412.1 MAG: hypothetical protein EAZ24_03700 [Burkholderiales bacterium]
MSQVTNVSSYVKNFAKLSATAIIATAFFGNSNSVANTGERTKNVSTWGFGLKTVVGSGKLASERRAVELPFSKIDIQDGLSATIRRAGAVNVSISADDNLISLVEVKVKDGVLIARIKPNSSLRTKNPMQLTIDTPTLESLRVQDGARATVDRISGAKATLRVSDGASVTLAQLEATDEIDIAIADGANVTITQVSKAPIQKIRLSDGARLEVGSNEANARAVATLSDGARLVLRKAAFADFDLKASDGASATIAGSARTQVYLLQDGASLDARECTGEQASVLASDASSVTLGKLAKIEVALQDGARVRHAGEAEVTIKRGRRSQVSSY